MKKFLYRFFIELTNQAFLSKWLENFTKSSYSRHFIPTFVKTYKINETEMLHPITEYGSLHELFTRQLNMVNRPVAIGDEIVVSPVDAVVEEFGSIDADQTFIAKGKSYSISEMLHRDEVKKKYINGIFLILYLSPSHYHRIHAPISGDIIGQWSLGTSSYPVNNWGITYGKSPFTKNYRVISEVVKDDSHLAIVKVGAMFVNGIELTHEGDKIKKGEEIGFFEFGSTIILLFEKDSFTLNPSIHKKMDILVGQPLGTLKKRTMH
ncbi:phosphatidylserine decarboxylase [Bacillus suaedaesalsae]|uniref:phosphatidylserine decarboxylase n=1 Tax=Bacillus suaedaesalsae TaxID=2810349 RepID=A0ABS2DMT3_9BACI|nr:phosphatidylserine decarboxylase [Bacillus suaedaesalsae]MBM6619662.1 phosphatidylserine decarboxylase [Bacillus suaedaesalsae]